MQQTQFVGAAPPQRPGMSKWWPISFFIAAAVFIIIGGGLVGSWSNSGYYGYSSGLDDAMSQFYGGVACFAIGGVCKLTAWILLAVYCARGRRVQTTVTYVDHSHPMTNYTPAAPATTTTTIPVYTPATPAPPPPPFAPANSKPASVQQAGGVVFCGQCGAAVSSPFCTQCGTRRP